MTKLSVRKLMPASRIHTTSIWNPSGPQQGIAGGLGGKLKVEPLFSLRQL